MRLNVFVLMFAVLVFQGCATKQLTKEELKEKCKPTSKDRKEKEKQMKNCLKKESANGNGIASFYLGEIETVYIAMMSRSAKYRNKEGCEYYILGAQQGYPKSMYAAAKCYENQYELKDMNKAKEWYKKAKMNNIVSEKDMRSK